MEIKAYAEKTMEYIKKELPNLDGIRYIEEIKNNGVIKHGITMGESKDEVKMIQYLDEYYENGISEEMVARRYLDRYNEEKNYMDGVIEIANKLRKLENIQTNIHMQLINKDRNSQLLKDCPHIDVVSDLCAIFYVKFDNAICKITNPVAESWGLKEPYEKELLEIAMKNRQPESMKSMVEVLKEILEEEIDIEVNVPMYVLSNDEKKLGASIILYDGVLDDALEKLQTKGIYILPSSVHEVILIPAEEYDNVAHLQKMVQSINENSVLEEEFLSNNIFFFSDDTGLILAYSDKEINRQVSR